MLMNLLIGLSTMAACLLAQSVLLVVALRYYARHGVPVLRPGLRWVMIVLCGVMTLLVIGNMVQITIWAMVFRMLGEFGSMEDAIYHSAVNFATLGYGDVVMSRPNKLLGPIEAINGVLMVGISTAVLMAGFQDAINKLQLTRNGQE